MKRGRAADAAKEADFYDRVYGERPSYQKGWRTSPYLVLWNRIMELLDERECDSVLEVGCGTGQFAEMLGEHGLGSYEGFDFSSVAIEMAAGRSVPEGYRFSVEDVRTGGSLPSSSARAVVCTEVLEHLDDDLGMMGRLPRGALFVGSVPTRDSAAHVRFFPKSSTVRARYRRFLPDVALEAYNRAGRLDLTSSKSEWFLIVGTVG